MKVCLISFDFFNFDSNIVTELRNKKNNVDHIDISKFKYQYTSLFDRIANFFNKNFLKKNIKKIEMEKSILKRLKNSGNYDVILVIRPDCISKKTHLEIKKYTQKYISYLYDSCTRFPIDHLRNGVFDEIFSFDLNDCKKFDFKFITNYIYTNKKQLPATEGINNNIFIIISLDERFFFLNKLANYLSKNNIDYKFILIGKRKPKHINPNIIYSKENIYIEDLKDDHDYSKIFLDLIREGHNGLSFRIFEALAMQKKIITTNKSISQYDFYNPNNILILDEAIDISINPNFFITPYEPLSDAIYHKYTIENWVKTIFNL